MVRILYVLAPGEPSSIGGIQSYQRGIMQGMRERGHQLVSLAMLPEEVLEKAKDRWPRRDYWHPQFLWRGAYYQDFRYHQELERRVRVETARFHPDLIHVFHLFQLGALRAADMPSIVTCHGLEMDPTRLVRDSLRSATAIHCNSSFTCGLARAILPQADRRRVLRWGVQARMAASSSPDYDLITVSRLVKRKNVSTVLRALQSRPQLRYAIVGDGPRRASLEQLSRELGLKRVEFLGEVDEDTKWKLLARSRAFILSPRNDLGNDLEGLGLCYYEAFGARLPVIAARSGGVVEAVDGGGILVENPLDAEEIGQAIDTVLDLESYGQWKEKVLRRARTESWEGFLDAFEAFYDEVAGGSEPGRLPTGGSFSAKTSP